jgi:hypothetical protein
MNFPPPDPYNIYRYQVKRFNWHLSFEFLTFSYVIIELHLHILHCLPYFILFFICFLFEFIQVFIPIVFSYFDYLISF